MFAKKEERLARVAELVEKIPLLTNEIKEIEKLSKKVIEFENFYWRAFGDEGMLDLLLKKEEKKLVNLVKYASNLVGKEALISEAQIRGIRGIVEAAERRLGNEIQKKTWENGCKHFPTFKPGRMLSEIVADLEKQLEERNQKLSRLKPKRSNTDPKLFETKKSSFPSRPKSNSISVNRKNYEEWDKAFWLKKHEILRKNENENKENLKEWAQTWEDSVKSMFKNNKRGSLSWAEINNNTDIEQLTKRITEINDKEVAEIKDYEEKEMILQRIIILKAQEAQELAENKELVRQWENYSSVLEEKEKEFRKIEEENQELKKQVKNPQSGKREKELEATITDYEKKLEEWEEWGIGAKAYIENKNKELSDAKKEVEKEKNTAEHYEKDNKSKDEKIKKLEAEVENKQKELEKYTNQDYNHYQKTLLAYQEENKKLSDLLKDKNKIQKIARKEEVIIGLERQLSEAQQKQEATETELEKFKEKVQSYWKQYQSRLIENRKEVKIHDLDELLEIEKLERDLKKLRKQLINQIQPTQN